jgi:hypothetical protein
MCTLEKLEIKGISFMFDNFICEGVGDEWEGFTCEAELAAVGLGEEGWRERRGEIPFDTVA